LMKDSKAQEQRCELLIRVKGVAGAGLAPVC
jgi:hypothetical protein